MLENFNNKIKFNDYKNFLIISDYGVFIASIIQFLNIFIKIEMITIFSLILLIISLFIFVYARHIDNLNKNNPNIVSCNEITKYHKYQFILLLIVILCALNKIFTLIFHSCDILFWGSMTLISYTFILQTKDTFKLQEGELKC